MKMLGLATLLLMSVASTSTAQIENLKQTPAVTTAPYVLVPLDVATVTTGGTAVTALTAGHRTRGGFLKNPDTATIPLCINEQGTASGTVSAGATTCILPGQSYNLAPSPNAVSIITSDSAHPVSGMGYN